MFQQFQLFPNVFVLRICHCFDCVMGVGHRRDGGATGEGQGESSKITKTRIWVSNCRRCYRYRQQPVSCYRKQQAVNIKV